MLELTDDAVEVVRDLIVATPFGIGPGGVRITCEAARDGVTFRVDVVALPAEDDEVIEQGEARVYLDPETAVRLDEKVLDAGVEGDDVAFRLVDAR